MTGYFHRDISPTIIHALGEIPVVVITGMRQSGKSTFLQNQPELKKRHYVSFDDFAQLASAREDPDGFVNTDEPITIDEAQKCPEILTAIKRRVDKKRRSGQFLLSGSASFTMLKRVSESLAGRAVYFTLHPFTRREITKSISEKPFLYNFFETQQIQGLQKLGLITAEDVLQGGMPSVCLGETKDKLVWFKGYEQTYLERDVRDLSQVANIIAFRQLIHLTALRTGQLLSPSQIGRDAKLNAVTTSRYLSLLEASFIINRINPYLNNRSSRLIKSPKLYLSDSGLACFLAGIDNLEDETLKGALFETYITQNLMGTIDARWQKARLYFWNIQGRYEVDFIIEAGNKCLAIETKSSARWNEKDLSGLNTFLATTPHCIGGILAYNGTEAVKLGNKLWAIPLSTILS
jgi:predicted AAA+ superfamily ATPase